MPGRTAAKMDGRVNEKILQWRAGQLPGRTRCSGTCTCPTLTPFNGGPGNCPAEPEGPDGGTYLQVTPSMEGRAIARPNKKNSPVALARLKVLQWRAGQLPGRTRRGRGWCSGCGVSFNGGPGNCPAERGRVVRGLCEVDGPSMEGRAIARPNALVPVGAPPSEILQWRAGQLPGRTPNNARTPSPTSNLQWRAGQLPGRTGFGSCQPPRGQSPFNGGPGNCPAEHHPAAHHPRQSLIPSMEGRAIARPNQPCRWCGAIKEPAFNGGPGNCPAELASTIPPSPPPSRPSMEGRAIARPNLTACGSRQSP